MAEHSAFRAIKTEKGGKENKLFCCQYMTEKTIRVGLIVAAIFISATLVFAREMDIRTLRKRIATLESVSSTTIDRMDRNQLCKGDCVIVNAPPDLDPEMITPPIVVKTDYPIENTYCYNYCLDDGKGPRACRNECQDTPEIYTRIGRDEALQLLIDASGLKYRPATEETVTKNTPAKLVR